MARRRVAPSVTFSYEPPEYENGRERAFIKPDVVVPGIQEGLVGGYRRFDYDKDDTVLLGHPEAAGQFERNYDRNDPYLGGEETIRRDLNFVSAEEIRRKSKQGY